MIDLQEYIDNKLDSMDYEFRLSREHMDAESDIVREFFSDMFDPDVGCDFFRYDETTHPDLYDISLSFGDERIDYGYDELRNWLVDPNHDGEYYFAKVIKDGLVQTGSDFDFFKTIQAAQVEEAIDAIQYAYDSEIVTPVIVAMFMQNQGYKEVNEELLDRAGELMTDRNIFQATIEAAIEDAKEELGLDDKEVGTKAKEKEDKTHDER